MRLRKVGRIAQKLLYAIPAWRKYFWNSRAEGIHAAYGEFAHDYATLSQVIDDCSPLYLLDFGCGSGRLIPLYLKKGIPNIHCYDVSTEALFIARRRFPDSSIHFTRSLGELTALGIVFDLVVCTRVLQHIPPAEIEEALRRLAGMSRRIYLNEATQPVESFFMFTHDYQSLLGQFGFSMRRRGTIFDNRGNAQDWRLFQSDALETGND